MQHGLLNSYVALFPIGGVSIGSSECDMDLSVSHVMLFPQELVEQMLIRLDLAVAASPKLRPAVRQLVPALLGPQVNNLKMLFSFEIEYFSSSKAEEPGPDLVEVGGGQVNGEAALRGVEHLHLSRDPRHGTEFLLFVGACVRPWSKACLPSQVRLDIAS